MTCFV